MESHPGGAERLRALRARNQEILDLARSRMDRAQAALNRSQATRGRRREAAAGEDESGAEQP